MTIAALKLAVKSALVEGIRENRDDLRDIVAEVIEDLALANAIREGENTKRVARSIVMRHLKGLR